MRERKRRHLGLLLMIGGWGIFILVLGSLTLTERVETTSPVTQHFALSCVWSLAAASLFLLVLRLIPVAQALLCGHRHHSWQLR